jgi:uncharacterized delta-60 repeat protein
MRGEVDRSFGKDGHAVVRLDSAFASSRFTSIARRPDGRFLVAGPRREVEGIYSEVGGFLQQRNADGSLDPGFGVAGELRIPNVAGIALQPDGKIVIGIGTESPCVGSGRVRRLLPDGSPDATFGQAGTSGELPIDVDHVAIDSSGAAVVAGRAGPSCGKSGGDPQLAVARLLEHGGLDPGFGVEGVARAETGLGLKNQDESRGLAIREDGSILAASATQLLGLTPTGALDPAFGQGGVVEFDGIGALLGLPDGGAALAGSGPGCCPGTTDFVLGRYRSDGTPDPGFGTGGLARFDLGPQDRASALVLSSDGGVVLGGATGSEDCAKVAAPCESDPVMVRFTPAGEPDLAFGQGGAVRISVPESLLGPGYDAPLTALALSPSGGALAGGAGGDESDAFLFAARADGSADPGFGSAGFVFERSLLPSTLEVARVAVGGGGRILVSASGDSGAHRKRPIIIGLRRNGRLDRVVGDGRGYVAPERPAAFLEGDRGRVFAFEDREGDRRGIVQRIRRDGSLDPRFGPRRRGRAALPAGFDAAALVARADGRVVVAGRMHSGRMAAFQLTARGRPDRSFGRRGLAVVRWGGKGGDAEARAAAIDDRGRLVLFGDAPNSMGAVRLLRDGRLDRSFGNRGRRGGILAPSAEVSKVAFQPGGGIVIASGESFDDDAITRLFRLTPDGDVDKSFGNHGSRPVPFGTPPLALAATRGQIVVAVPRGYYGENGVTLLGYGADGSVDRRFGRGGQASVSTGRGVFRAISAAVQNGRIVVAGTRGKLEQVGSAIELVRFR